MQINKNEHIHNLEKIASDYSMTASDTYNLLLSKNDADFPLSFEIVKYKVLKDIPCDILQSIFTLEELKNIFRDTNIKKVKNPQTRKLIISLS